MSSPLSDSASRDERARRTPLLLRVLGTGLFSGYFPIASGTFGSLVAALIYWFIPGMDTWYVLLAVCVLTFIPGTIAAAHLEKEHGGDPSIVVIDEFLGMWIALLGLPKELLPVILGFFAFRFFDIAKVPPANYFDQRRGGLGIMLDDVVAGIYANILVRVVLFIAVETNVLSM